MTAEPSRTLDSQPIEGQVQRESVRGRQAEWIAYRERGSQGLLRLMAYLSLRLGRRFTRGVLYGIAAALPHMRRQNFGHVINVSSVAGHKVRPGSAVYSATKHAVRVISEGLREELTPSRVRTTVISPGAVATELAEGITEPDVAEAARRMYETTAIPADSLARAVLFAISQPQEVDVNEILFRPTAQAY